MSKESKIAVIGAGYWGKNLVRNFHKLGALKIICDNSNETCNKLTKQYTDIVSTANYKSILDDPDINGIVVAVPAEGHFSFAVQAIEAGKHVYVEKPLTVKVKDAEELVRKAKMKDIVLMVGHLLQYHPVFQRLKEIVSSGELGKIYYIYSNRLNLGKIRREENILWSFAPHDISMILSLTGEDPINVYATGGQYLQDKISDVTITHLAFPNGIKSHIFVSWLHPFKEQKLVVIGEKKMAVFSDTEEWENKLLIYPHSIKWENSIPVPLKADPDRIKVEESEPLENECLHFLRCIEKKVKPITDGEEGLRVLRVLDLAQKSLDKGGK